MEIEPLDELIGKHKLQHIADDIRALARESIRLRASPARQGARKRGLKAGGSRLGGLPDLPDGVQWPAPSLSFVAQICLEDIAGFSPAQDLPDAGLLSFFYDAVQQPDGSSPDEWGGWRVYFFEPALECKPAAFPTDLPVEARFAPLNLRFWIEWTLPVNPRQAQPNLLWTEPDQRAYELLLREFHPPGDRKRPHHRMFGWPDQIQDDMPLQAALMTQDDLELDDPRAMETARGKPNWQLLLQVDSDDRAGMRWGSYGMIYYWIEEQALKARRFDQTWLALQSD